MDFRYHILKKTGFSFYSNETAGMTLEFIGTSGVGKTTLYRETMARLRNRWFFAHQLDFIKRKAPPSVKDRVLMEILKSRIDKIINSEAYCPWHSLLDLKLSVRVIHETMITVHSSHPQGFVFDEGLFRHFPAEILLYGKDFPVQLWQNRAFVYLRARSPETALARLKSRTMSLAQIAVQREITDEQLLARIIHDQEMFQSIVGRASSFGCPVLVLDAEDPLMDSINKVLNFEKSLHQKFSEQKEMKTNSKPRTLTE